MSLTPHQFIAKWQPNTLSERATSIEHFCDLCQVLGQPTPNDADPTGDWFTFEKGVQKGSGGKGFADVWRRGFFGWEYKGRHKDLAKAYAQLLNYREALLNPPLLIVCDRNRFEIHTNFTGTAKEVHAFDLDGLADPLNLAKLRLAFTDPDQLKPGRTQKQVTEDVAKKFAEVADGMRGRGIEPHRAGHFLMKLMFCMFAEDIDLLPKDLFLKTVTSSKWEPDKLSKRLADLFEAMAHPGGTFGADEIPWFNGGLFQDAEVIDLTPTEIRHLEEAANFDWSAVEPSIFGTLFERILNPEKRSQLGAHYTSRDDILTLLEPVMMDPLRREWDAVKAKADKLWDRAKGVKVGGKAFKETRQEFEKCVFDFLDRLAQVGVLDPACGSGNFLYVALHRLLDLEKEVLTYASTHGLNRFPLVRPTQLRGIEKNEYAQELAQVVIWIGYLQWLKENGYQPDLNPVLDAMENIENRDAILDLTDPANPKEPDWPDAEFIVGNPPFLGGKMLRTNLGDSYVDAMFRVWGERVRPEADLVVYWFEKARAMIEAKRVKRAGLLATQGIRGGANRDTLARIKRTGDIFFAVSDREWVLDGAAVHISMVGFDDGTETTKLLDGQPATTINANLTKTADITQAKRLTANAGIGFMGDTKGGPFDIELAEALQLLRTPNVNGRPSSDVITPWCNGLDITRRNREMWIIDFGIDMQEGAASLYESAFEITRNRVYPERQSNKREAYRLKWWLHVEARSGMRRSFESLSRFVGMPRVAKHLLFTWFAAPTLPDSQIIAFACSDDYFLGVLHSRVHEVWALRMGTRLEDRPRYTPTTCFETFPFPEPTAAQREAIAIAAKELDEWRSNWLNPPEWTKTEYLEFPGSVDGPWKRYVTAPNDRGIGTVRYPRLVPKDGQAAGELKKRTLTNLYNERPAWLANAHRKLDEAVFAAYGWPVGLSDDELLAKLLDLNLSRAGSAAPVIADGEEE